MKKFLAAVTAIIMALSLVTVPVAAEKDAFTATSKLPANDPTEVIHDFKTDSFAQGQTNDEPPETLLNGYIAWDPAGTSGIWGQFSDANPSAVENKGAMESTFAGAFAGGNVYGYLDSGAFYITNAETFQTSYPGTAANVLVVAMAYNHANNIMYAIAQDPNDYSINLYTADLATGMLTQIAPIDCPDMIATLAIDGEGNAYGINMGPDAALWSIDLETAACEMIGRTDHDMNYVQGMTWDFNSNMIYWAQYDGVTAGCLCIVDPATGAATECGAIGGGAEVTALWIANDIEIPEITMPECAITFMDGFTGEEIEGGYTVEAGTVLDPADFPEAPEHAGLEFTGWDYAGQAIYADTVITAKYRDPNAIGFYFETDPAVDGWTWEDHDGDGNNWRWLTVDNAGSDWGYPEGQGCMNSESFVNYVGPLTPDNWLISPEVPGGGMVSFILCAQDGGYADEHIGVYASADGGETWSEELGYFTPKDPGPNFTYTVSLAEYEGMNIKLAFRHYDSTDAFSVNLDAVEVSAGSEVPPTEEPPTEEPAPQEGDVIFDIRNPETEDGLYYAQPGETVAVNLTVTGEYAAHGANIWLDYDPEMLTVDHIVKGEVLTENAAEIGALVLLDYETIPGSIRLGITAAVDPLTQEGIIYTVYFTVGENVPADTVIPLTLNIKEFVNMPIGEPATTIPTFAYNSGIVVGEEPVPPTEEPPTEEPPTEEPPTEEPPAEVIGFYFETDPALDGWTWEDHDGDGNNWDWNLAPDHQGELYTVPEGEGCMISFSYINDGLGGGTPVTPDNWLISPEVAGGGSVSFKIVGQDPGYASEVVGVYASVDGGENWDYDLGCFTATGSVQTITIDLADFADMNIKLAFRHYNVTDQFCLNLDAVEVTTAGGEVPPTEEPPTEVPPTEVPPTEVPPTEVPPTEVPPTEEPPTEEPPTAEPEPQEGDVIFDIRNSETEDGLYYAQPGETVAVELTVTGEYAAHGANIWLDYDPEMLTVDHIDKGEVLTENAAAIGALVLLDHTTIPGSIRLGITAAVDPLTQEGIIYTVYFTVGENVPVDTVIPLDLNIKEFVNMPIGEPATEIPTFAYDSSIVAGEEPVPPTPTPEPTPVPEPTPQPGDSIFDLGGAHPANAGGLVEVELKLTGEFEAHGANIWLNYDPELLTIEKVENGSVLDEVTTLDGQIVLDYETIPGSLRLAVMCPDAPLTANGTVIKVFFRVAEGLEDGTEIPLELLVNEFFNMPIDGENTPIPYFIYPGSVLIDSTYQPPAPPVTGFVSLAGAGIASILAGAGVVLFRRKRH